MQTATLTRRARCRGVRRPPDDRERTGIAVLRDGCAERGLSPLPLVSRILMAAQYSQLRRARAARWRGSSQVTGVHGCRQGVSLTKGLLHRTQRWGLGGKRVLDGRGWAQKEVWHRQGVRVERGAAALGPRLAGETVRGVAAWSPAPEKGLVLTCCYPCNILAGKEGGKKKEREIKFKHS